MQFFIVLGIIIFAALFLLMSLPIYDDDRVEPDTKKTEQVLD